MRKRTLFSFVLSLVFSLSMVIYAASFRSAAAEQTMTRVCPAVNGTASTECPVFVPQCPALKDSECPYLSGATGKCPYGSLETRSRTHYIIILSPAPEKPTSGKYVHEIRI